MMNIDVLSIFPEMFEGVFGHSILKKAAEKGAAGTMSSISVTLPITNTRQWMTIHMAAVLEWC